VGRIGLEGGKPVQGRVGEFDEEVFEEVRAILNERGMPIIEQVRREILSRPIKPKGAYEAMKYFLDYWVDLTRPTLLITACEALGVNPELAYPLAKALILISGGIDVHDDLIDGSEVKFGKKTLLGRFGEDLALLVGDALIMEGYTYLYELSELVGVEKTSKIAKLIRDYFFELGEAEASELSFRGRLDWTPTEALKVIRMKAADVEGYMRMATVLAGASRQVEEALAEYGRILGMLVIMKDELADTLLEDELRHRMERETLPLPLLYAICKDEARERIKSILEGGRLTEMEVREIIQIIDDAGGFKRVVEEMKKLGDRAVSCLSGIGLESSRVLVLLVRAVTP